MSYGRREPVKVVVIDTHYVETDARSFKSVVQNLTGKDSKVTISPEEGFSNKRHEKTESCSEAVLMRDLSFKDFDRLLKEMPSIDELYRLCHD